jgi:hypothetical protein
MHTSDPIDSIAAALARDGFDVYLMDHTGYGRSPRPMMDNPCNVDPSQQQLLVPNPLAAPCSPSYSHHLVTIFTELPEIDCVVDYIRKQTGRNRILLAGSRTRADPRVVPNSAECGLSANAYRAPGRAWHMPCSGLHPFQERHC